MVIDGIVDSVAEVVLVVGIPLLIALFFLEGLVLGKILQPPAVFVTVIAISQPGVVYITFLCAGCTLAVGTGQWITFRSFHPNSSQMLGIRARWPRLDALPGHIIDHLGDRRLDVVNSGFDRFGGIGIAIATFLPVVRGTFAVPAGMSTYPTNRFVLVTLIANAGYFTLLVAVAFGILRILGI